MTSTTSSALVENLMQAASEQERLFDFGGGSFIAPMTRLFHALDTEANLTEQGWLGVQADANRWLANRLRIQRDLAKHPEIAEEVVNDPIVIVGVPRTGTTKLHRMMGQDMGVQTLAFWQNLNPAPFPDARPGGPDPRLVLAQGYVDQLSTAFPDLLNLHEFVAEEPEEEVILLEMSCRSPSAGLFFDIPSFQSWLVAESQVPLYEELKLLLQYQQWQNGGRQSRPWVLKSPMHLGRIAALLEVFPEATVVHCHRDMASSMASLCNLVEAARRMRSDTVDSRELGAFILDFCSSEWERNLEQRAQSRRQSQLLDVSYKAIHENPVKVIREIYGSRDQRLSEEAETAMLAWAERNLPRAKPLVNPPDHYAVTPEAVASAFAAYNDRFDT